LKGSFVRKVFIYIILVLCISMNFAGTPKTSKSTFLFCLKKEVSPLQIESKDGRVSVDIQQLNKFFDTNGIDMIEPWLPGATEMDYNGDVYLNRIYRIHIKESHRSELSTIVEKIAQFQFIEYSENEYIRKPFYIPNDTNLDNQCSINAVGADKAWDYWNIPSGIMPGDREVLLASVDTGVDYTHPDLWKNIWIVIIMEKLHQRKLLII
jgi:hypothetical protein